MRTENSSARVPRGLRALLQALDFERLALGARCAAICPTGHACGFARDRASGRPGSRRRHSLSMARTTLSSQQDGSRFDPLRSAISRCESRTSDQMCSQCVVQQFAALAIIETRQRAARARSVISRVSAKPRNAQRDCALSVDTPRVRSSAPNVGARSSMSSSSAGAHRSSCASQCGCGARHDCGVKRSSARLRAQQRARRRAAAVAGIGAAEHAALGARAASAAAGPRRIAAATAPPRRSRHTAVCSCTRQQRNRIDRRRPALLVASGDPQAVVREPRVDQLPADPDRRERRSAS